MKRPEFIFCVKHSHDYGFICSSLMTVTLDTKITQITTVQSVFVMRRSSEERSPSQTLSTRFNPFIGFSWH